MNDKITKLFDMIKIFLFAAVMVAGFVIGLLFFMRPVHSDAENRDLTKFPKFTIESFLSGGYTDQISRWYSDTYPLRESMSGVNNALQSLYGLRTEQIIGAEEGDDIPDQPMDPLDPDGEIEFTPADDGQGEQIGGMYVNGDTAYQLYSFNKQNSEAYVKLINKFAAQVEGEAQVYTLIAPLHYQLVLSDETIQMLSASDAEEAINYMYSGFKSSSVKTVDALRYMQSHASEYLYFRTDHHWTARGAYYAYVAFCQSKNISPTPLSSYERLQFDGFLGTLYAGAKQPPAMKSNPDYVEAFVPMGTNTITVTEKSGNVVDYQIVNKNTDAWYPAAGAKYNCFIAGDNPVSEIHNQTISDGSGIVVVKESYGNAFIPFLVDSYEYVYVIDYRYWNGHLADFVTEKGIDDVLFLNVVSNTSTTLRLQDLQSIIE